MHSEQHPERRPERPGDQPALVPPRTSLPDPRNADILVWVDGALRPRGQATVSVFDSSVQGGDAVWEGLRVYDGGIFRLGAHLARLSASARALSFAHVPSAAEITAAIAATLAANGMRDGAHIRLTLTRGRKLTSGMSPAWNTEGSCLIVLAEWKPPVYGTRGLHLVTSSVRRNPPQCLPSRIHHANLLNNILAKLEANAVGADDAIMLDVEGFVAETNATNLFLVAGGTLVTPLGEHCLPGITRAAVLDLARAARIPVAERRVTLAEFHVADEVFTTGTMGELAHVVAIDGRRIGPPADAAGGRLGSELADAPGPITRRLSSLFRECVARERELLAP